MLTLGGICLSLAAVGAPEGMSTAESGRRKETVKLNVVSHLDRDDQEALSRKVGDAVLLQLSRRQVPVADRASLRVTVVVRWLDEAHTTYGVEVTLTAQDEVLANDRRPCELCSTTELFESISLALAEVVRVVPDEAQAPPTHVVSPPHALPPPSARSALKPPKRLSGLGWTGVGISAVGAAVLSSGAAVWSKGVQTRVEPTNVLLLEQRDYRPPGIALVATGASILAAGVVVVAVDAVRQRRHRRRRPTVAPQLASTSAGLALQGEF